MCIFQQAIEARFKAKSEKCFKNEKASDVAQSKVSSWDEIPSSFGLVEDLVSMIREDVPSNQDNWQP
jgi:hypothetical protein